MSGNTPEPNVPADSGYPEPGGRAPAPAPLRLLQVFANTADREAGQDALDNTDSLTAWLGSYGLFGAGTQATDEDLALAIELREGLRSLFLTHHDGGHSEAAHDDGGHLHGTPAPDTVVGLERLDRALEQLPVRVVASGGEPRVEPVPQPPVREALARIGAVLVHADPAQLQRLKACRRDVCRWVFFDTSRNRGGTWCAMEICGARTKMQAYRKRNA
ncbi:CGNR zinc finger domain-containing protein [Arthrobacter sp. zg-Y1171]|uniref:CGNR zinc finger domain-containing protein n=1 Tax=Arthrobacter sp. zg-Y1171 TaxID=2964610 RepID=UPI002103BE4A|nr:CGNR zinc finger domain-containing protein [Arthrobacter sp. zg-Y1171]MCQ1994589.1 CGNR zinc finger domain-containing protein [Arthrobacter sp. zg-Y1171]UWX81331.1 CGNR zinc finger domain-containing protein [Arthrobacter sp. zg-Y1171]